MDLEVYQAEAKLEAAHWWFVGRRRLFSTVIRSLALGADDRVLDIGTGAGTNLRMYEDLGFQNVTGTDFSWDALSYCREKSFGGLVQGRIERLPFPNDGFALITATDVIEHLDDDEAALDELGRVLRPGGRLIITVPCFDGLWGWNDIIGHHRRRYKLPALSEKIERAGLHVQSSFYFNFILFPVIWLARKLLNCVATGVRSETEINTPFINKILTACFRMDVFLAPRLKPPFGVSAFFLVEKP